MLGKSIAYLATGDEICNGDILNSNGQEIALRLITHDMPIGMHMAVADHLEQMTTAMHFLLQHHRALIITGGLGPTSDDLTRDVVARLLNRPLIFNEPTWESIVDRLKKFGYHTPPESNRQQAFFPEGAIIIPNPNGTASGFLIETDAYCIFVLPGPPLECLPMIDYAVLPFLLKRQWSNTIYCEKWLCFGVSEAQIAEEMDLIAAPFRCNTGYRYCYPYTEVKIYSHHKIDIDLLRPLIEKMVAPHIVGDGKTTASALLKKELQAHQTPIIFYDRATGGLLEAMLQSPNLYSFVRFTSTDDTTDSSILMVVISGLGEFWHQTPAATHTTLTVTLRKNNEEIVRSQAIALRGDRVKLYAVEWISRMVYEHTLSNARHSR